ncbi:hypothetical protein [Anabaena azotica]|uniref:Uncharacterized protein n=1 Tax=Anabaena azotica FACHB-119 TaxID=947527 RepID=A0ABR8CZS9_9NOST|nr:hypothetical protein [Anabaena azotica]MBD2500455.1 hypothetical protein [Anabaena azotica FACHB-119]
MKQQKTRRSRGVTLTLQGWAKLQDAKEKAEWKDNAGDGFSLEELSDRPHQRYHQKCNRLEK